MMHEASRNSSHNYDAEYREKIIEITNKLLQSRFGLWNALLTVNGVLLGILSGFSIVSGEHISISVKIVLVLCVISLCLLIYCYVSTMQTYYRIGEFLLDEGENLSEEAKKRDLRNSIWRHRLTFISEIFIFFFLFVEAVVIVNSVMNA